MLQHGRTALEIRSATAVQVGQVRAGSPHQFNRESVLSQGQAQL